jgi:hypothetical protein
LSFGGALSDKRSGLPFVSLCQYSLQWSVSIYILCYISHLQCVTDETVIYGYGSCRTQPVSDCTFVRDGTLQEEERNLKPGLGPQRWHDTKTNWLTDSRSQYNLNLNNWNNLATRVLGNALSFRCLETTASTRSTLPAFSRHVTVSVLQI